MERWSGEKLTSDRLIIFQIWLWEACLDLCGGDGFHAAEKFLGESVHPTNSGFWRESGYLRFNLFAACSAAKKGKSQAALEWLKLLFEVANDFDPRVVRRETILMGDEKIRQLLTPNIVINEDHGMLLNHITITNHSVFVVHSIGVTASFLRTDGKIEKAEKVVRTTNKLEPGESYSWKPAFPNASLFGGNISQVSVVLKCQEDA